MITPAGRVFRKIGLFSLLGYFCSTVFSHALAQNLLAIALLSGLLIIIIEKIYMEKYHWGLFSIFIFLFIGWSILSAVFSPEPLQSLFTLKEEWLFLMIPAIVFFLNDEQSIKMAVKIFAVSAILISLYAVWQHFFGMDLYRGTQLLKAPTSGYSVRGMFSHRLTFGNYMSVASVLFIGMAPYFKSKISKSILYSAFCLSALATVFSYSRGPITVLVLGLIGFLIIHRTRFIKPVLLIIFGLAVIILTSSPDIFSRHVSLASMEWKGEYAGSRLSIWRTAGKMTIDHPLLGVGPGNFQNEFINYRDEHSDRQYSHAHNDPLNVAAYAGIPGVLFYLGFWGIVILKMLVLLRDKNVKGFIRGAVVGLFLATMAFFMTSIYEATFADEEIRMLLMALWGLFFVIYLQVKTIAKEAETLEKA